MRRIAGGLLALLCYGGLLTYLTWPLVPKAATDLPKTTYGCGFDNLYSGWTLAHQSTALVTDPARLADGKIFHPATDTLYYGPTAIGALPYFAPVFLATGNPTLALNAMFCLSIVLTAWALHMVVRRWTSSHLAGAVAGTAFLLTPWILWEWLPTTPHCAVLQYLPLIIYLSALSAAPATPPRRRARFAALFGLVALQCLTDLVYVAPAVLAPLAVLGLARLARRGSRSDGVALLGAVALTALLLLIPAAGHLRVQADNPKLDRQTFWPIGPDFFHRFGTPIPWGLLYRNAPTALPPAAFYLIGAGALSLAASRGARHRQAWAAAALWAGLGAFMSLTPTVRWGERAIDLPQAWLASWLPFYGHIRVPSRLGVSGLIGLALLAGLAFAECAARIAATRRLRAAAPILNAALALAIVAAMFAQYRGRIPAAVRADGALYRLAPAPAPGGPVMDVLGRPGGPLLELPAQLLPPERAPEWHARAMYRSIFHGRRILNGYASYWPAGFVERMVLASRIPDPGALAELRRETGLELFLVHGDAFTPASRARWVALAEEGGRADLRLVARDGDELLFALAAGPALP